MAAHAGLGPFGGGFIGVDVFFVLSGFLITGLLLDAYTADGKLSLLAFYARRARRILPAGTLVLIVTVFACYALLGASRATHIAGDAQWTALFGANLDMIRQSTNYLDAQLPPSPLQHFWSLGVEEQFYAVWPLAVITMASIARGIPLRSKLTIALCLIIAASLWWSIEETSFNGAEAYFSPLTRAWELGAGALLAVNAPRLLRLPWIAGAVMSWTGVLAILATALLFTSSTPFPGYAVILPVGSAALAVAGGTIAPGGGAEIILRLGLFQWIGKLSYSLYLWHWPLVAVAREYRGSALSLPETLALYLLAVVLSMITFALVEDPVRHSIWLRQRSPLVSVVLGICIVALSFGIISISLIWLGPHITPAQPTPQVVFP